MSVVEQRYRAVLEVQAGCPVIEVAERYGVTRQTLHAWMRRYRDGGLGGLADRSHRPAVCPHQTAAEVEVLVCELRRAHPRWGPARLAHELQRSGVEPVPSQATLSRILTRNNLVIPTGRRRPRSSYQRWERDEPMQLWQLDIMGGVMLVDGRELKLISGIDDYSRFIVIAALVTRASARAVCTAFARALACHGVPEEVLTDNGKQFTGRFTQPRPTEVLFERICRDNGITTRHTKIRSPTTTGKVERWHRTVREEFLAAQAPFTSLPAAQQALDTWVADYNTVRPHQSLDMATPASRFAHRTTSPADQELPLRLPADLAALPTPTPTPPPSAPLALTPAVVPAAIEFDRIVPASGNMTAAGRQIWLGTSLAGQTVTVWVSATTLHVFHQDQLIKTHPITLTPEDLTRLNTRGRPGRPSPATALPVGELPADAVVEVDRLVNHCGMVSIAGKQISVGIPLAGKRVTLRIDAQLIHVITDGVLTGTRPNPLTHQQRSHLHGARMSGPAPGLPTQVTHVQRVVSSSGALMIAGTKFHIGHAHRGKVVTVVLEDTQFRVLHQGQELATHPRTTIKEVTRTRASGHINYET
ncbi:IS481 family transposase [Actinoallomurus bryophytorum]|uniref:IS481 family transposase n=1 Tax=Actinoallomurus bryophytorum TaxID=1490222 RepID=UPI0011521E10|nr:IS481 family transposase [Actinoallomurus bryophytorum]